MSTAESILETLHAGDGGREMALQVAAIYTDGGVIGPNPSRLGGTWAFCFVDAAGRRIFERSGVVEPWELSVGGLIEDERFDVVTNNVTEFLAMLLSLEVMDWLHPEWTNGKVYTDSIITLYRFQRPKTTKMNGVPPDFVERVRAIRTNEHGTTYHLLGGHPTRADLARGTRSDGKPVSEHNVWCDLACNRESAAFRTRKGQAAR